MTRIQWLVGLAALALIIAPERTPAAESAGEAALAQVPAKAPVVLHVHGYERAKARLATLLKNAVPDRAQAAQDVVDEKLKEALHGRELKGIVKDGSLFVAFLELPSPDQPEPVVGIFVPVTSYTEFRDGLLKEDERKEVKKEGGVDSVKMGEHEYYFVDRHAYAVVTRDKDAATRLSKDQPGLDGKLKGDAARRFLDSDLSLYVDMGSINKSYGDQLKGMRQLVPMMMGQVKGQDQNTIDMIKAMSDGLFQLLEDSRAFLLAFDFRPDGLALRAHVVVGSDTKSNTLLKDAKLGALDELNHLPQGQLGYTAVKFDKELAKLYQNFVGGAQGEGDEHKALKDAAQGLIDAGPKSVAMEFNMPPAGIQVWSYEDPAKALAASRRFYRALEAGSFLGQTALKDKPQLKENAQEHRGFKLDSVSIKWDLEKMAQAIPGQGGLDMLRKTVGVGSNVWYGTDGTQYVAVIAADWDAARAHLDTFLDGKDPISAQQPFAETRKQLPAEATMLALFDGPLYMAKTAELVGPMLAAQGVPFKIPHLKATPGTSYVGVAVSLTPENGSIELWLSVTSVKEIRKLVEQAMQQNQGGVD